MKSSRRNLFNFHLIITTTLFLVVISNSFAQRKSEIVSAHLALLRNPETRCESSLIQLGTILSYDTSKLMNSNRGLIVLKKVGSGFLLGSVFSLPGALIGGLLFTKNAWSAIAGGIIGSYVGYIYGSSYGVHLVSENYNPESSFGLTLVSGFLSIGGTYLISAITYNEIARTSAFIMFPIAFPIIYTELIE
jgi:hypothetical protein